MYRIPLASLRLLRGPVAGLTVFVVASHSPSYAQKASSACRLLQVADIESALGGKASTAPSGTNQNSPGVGLDVCSVEISGPGKGVFHRVDVSIVSGLPMDGGDALRARNAGTAREPQWTVKGARLEQSTVGATICILSGRPDVVGRSTCSIPRGKGYVEVSVTASVEAMVPLATVRALAQKAFGRL